MFNPGDAVIITASYLVSGISTQLDAAPTFQISNGTVTFPTIYTMARNTTNLIYEYTLTIPMDFLNGVYSTLVKGFASSVPVTFLGSSFEVGSDNEGYVTVAEIKASKLGYDFSKYDESVLATYSILARQMIENFLGYDFSYSGQVTEIGETIVDRDGRIFIKFRQKPVVSVQALTAWVPGVVPVVLNVNYLDVYPNPGYGYYNITIAWASNAGYPYIILSGAEKLSYSVTYTVAQSKWMPLLKQASFMIILNLIRADANFKADGSVGISSKVASFTSGRYTVRYDMAKEMKDYSNSLYNVPDVYMTNDVKAMLARLKSQGQNTF